MAVVNATYILQALLMIFHELVDIKLNCVNIMLVVRYLPQSFHAKQQSVVHFTITDEAMIHVISKL